VHKVDNAMSGRNRLEDLSPLPKQKLANDMYVILNAQDSTPDKYGESDINFH
jgi:hypothetical protein